jgi:hypothetical protein
MKTLFRIILLATVVGCARAQTEPAHEWKVTLKVVDETGQPVTGAETWVNYLTNRFIGFTDTNGIFTASHLDHSVQLAFQAQKTGYYSFGMQYLLGFRFEPVKWSPNVTLVLKRISKPIPMYARWVDSEPPAFKKTGPVPIAFSKSLGYDLMVGDWVAPYGNGQATDLTFTEEFNKKSISDVDFKLTISFPNTGDGIQEFAVPDVEKGSGLRSPHEAPVDGYQARLTRENYQHPGQTGKSDYDPNRNYFFRARTVLDENGNVKSTLYGKIYGDPEQMNFRYYLNPSPNGRNVEFDPKQNLLKGLKSFEEVSTP